MSSTQPEGHEAPRAAAVERIAREVLQLPTLDTRDADALDFHELAVWKIRDALLAAYDAGSATSATPRG